MNLCTCSHFISLRLSEQFHAIFSFVLACGVSFISSLKFLPLHSLPVPRIHRNDTPSSGFLYLILKSCALLATANKTVLSEHPCFRIRLISKKKRGTLKHHSRIKQPHLLCVIQQDARAGLPQFLGWPEVLISFSLTLSHSVPRHYTSCRGVSPTS